MIRRISFEDIDECLCVIRESFSTIAKEFGITKMNCPNHTSFMEAEKLRNQFSEGRPMFAYIDNQKIVGYFSLAFDGKSGCELNILAVLPEYRHKGYGEELINYAVNEAKKRGCNIISIAIIEENERLKKWYSDLGFIHTGTRKYDHIPFTAALWKLAFRIYSDCYIK